MKRSVVLTECFAMAIGTVFFHDTQISSYITMCDIQSQSTDSNPHSPLLSSITLEGRSFYNAVALGHLK